MDYNIETMTLNLWRTHFGLDSWMDVYVYLKSSGANMAVDVAYLGIAPERSGVLEYLKFEYSPRQIKLKAFDEVYDFLTDMDIAHDLFHATSNFVSYNESNSTKEFIYKILTWATRRKINARN